MPDRDSAVAGGESVCLPAGNRLRPDPAQLERAELRQNVLDEQMLVVELRLPRQAGAVRRRPVRKSSIAAAGAAGMILDNYGTRTHEDVKTWLAKHPRFHLHFIPTSSSWLNMIERWFRELTNKRIRRGVFRSVPDLISAIEEYLAAYNHDAKPFVWTAEVNTSTRSWRKLVAPAPRSRPPNELSTHF